MIFSYAHYLKVVTKYEEEIMYIAKLHDIENYSEFLQIVFEIIINVTVSIWLVFTLGLTLFDVWTSSFLLNLISFILIFWPLCFKQFGSEATVTDGDLPCHHIH